MHRAASLFLCLAVAHPALAQKASDPEVVRGIREVEEGDLNAGILTLDAAVRRLARDPARTRDLGQAHLYLGIAYVGKGQEGLARVQFRSAVASIPDLTLNPADYPPKVIELFDAARQDMGASSSRPAAAPPPKKRGGSKLPWILGGVAVAGGAGIAVAAGGGNTEPPAATPTVILMEAGTVIRGTSRKQYSVTIPRSGTVEVAVMWAEPDALVTVELYQPPATQVLQSSTPTTAMSPQRLTTAIAAGAYRIDVFLRTGPSAPISVGNVANYTIEAKLR